MRLRLPKLNSYYIYYACIAGLSLCSCAAFALYFHYSNYWWAVFAAFIAIQPNIGQSVMMSIGRFKGTWIGILVSLAIVLTYNYNWIFYPLFIVALTITLYFIIRPTVAWAYALTYINILNILLIGVSYPHGAAHFAIERGLEVSLSITLATIILIFCKFRYAYESILDLLPKCLQQYERIFLSIVAPYVKQTRPSRIYTIHRLLLACSAHLDYLLTQVNLSKFEIFRKKFNPRHALRLLHQCRRIELILMSLRQAGEYYQVQHCTVAKHDREILDQAKALCQSQFAYCQHILKRNQDSPPPHFDNKARQRLTALIRLNIRRLKIRHDDLYINRISWLTLILRLVEQLGHFESIIHQFFSNDQTDTSESIDREFGGLASSKRDPLFKLDPERWRYALQGGTAFTVVLLLQQYYQWSPMIAVVSGVAILITLASNFAPLFSNMGIGICGAICGGLYCWLALSILNYYPFGALFLVTLFIATAICAYLQILSQLESKPFAVFSLYFMMITTIILFQSPAERVNLNNIITMPLAMLLGIVTVYVVSRFICRYNYLNQYRTQLAQLMSDAAGICAALQHSGSDQAAIEDQLYLMRAKTAKCQHLLQQLTWQDNFSSRMQARGKHLLDYAELLTSCLVMMQVFFFRPAKNKQLLNHYLHRNQQTLKNCQHNFEQLAKVMSAQDFDAELLDTAQLTRRNHYHLRTLITSTSFINAHYTEIEAVLVVHNALQRLIDIQAKLNGVAESIQHDHIEISKSAAT